MKECLEIHMKIFHGDHGSRQTYRGKSKCRDKKGKKYTDIEGREEERIIKVRITSRKEEEKGEKCKEEEDKENQEEVIEIEPRQKTIHASND